MDKRFWGIILGLVVVFGIIFGITNHGNNQANSSSNSKPTTHIEGQGKDGVTLVEYGDYECPYCGEYYPIVKQVAAEYNQDITFQFRNLPLTQIHPNAFSAARAAEAASLQGKFWQMHDLLYTDQSQWVSSSDPTTYFDQYAQQLGLNASKFKQDYASTPVNNSITADMSAFSKTGAQEATPTFFLDGKQIQPSATVSSFEQVINADIKKKTGKDSGIGSSSASSSTPTTPTTTQQSKQ